MMAFTSEKHSSGCMKHNSKFGWLQYFMLIHHYYAVADQIWIQNYLLTWCYKYREEKCDVSLPWWQDTVIQSNLSLWTPPYYGHFIWSQKCQKSYIPYLYNMDTSVKRTLGYVSLVSVLKRFDSTCQFFFIFFCHICRTMVCWDPEILLPWQHDVVTSPLYSVQLKTLIWT